MKHQGCSVLRVFNLPRHGWTTLLLLVVILLSLLSAGASTTAASSSSTLPSTRTPHSPPLLSGRHFRITVIEEDGYITIQEDANNGQLSFSGYLIDILKELALRANFTYTLLTPSGYGSYCTPRLVDNATLPAYHKRYRQDYRCGESDVTDLPLSEYSTDFYWGAYYITPERLQVNKYTLPYSPPVPATLGMMGTATHIHSIHDLEGQEDKYKICALAGTAYMESIQVSFPHLHLQGIAKDQNVHTVLEEGICDIIIDAYPFLKRNILDFYLENKCLANGKPIGIIGEPLEYGLNYFAFGIRMNLGDEVVQTLNFWLQALMACFPNDPNGYCPNGQGSISQLYYKNKSGAGGRGDECGYVQFPPPPPNTNSGSSNLSPGAIAAIAITPVVLVLAMGMMYHTNQLKQQEQRMKKRFVQQLARAIEIGPTAKQIPAAKLSETFDHIGPNGTISKPDLAKWMADLNLDFLSERDFDRLFDAMDMDQTGQIDPLEFFAFLRECENQFQEVHREYSGLPKTEKVKLAARRLTNIRNLGGLEEVQKLERRNNKRSRQAVVLHASPSGRHFFNGKSNNNRQNSNMMGGESTTMAASTTTAGAWSDTSRYNNHQRLSSDGGSGLAGFRISENALRVASSTTSNHNSVDLSKLLLEEEESATTATEFFSNRTTAATTTTTPKQQPFADATTTQQLLPETDSLSDDEQSSPMGEQHTSKDPTTTTSTLVGDSSTVFFTEEEDPAPAGDNSTAFFFEELEKNFMDDIHEHVEAIDRMKNEDDDDDDDDDTSPNNVSQEQSMASSPQPPPPPPQEEVTKEEEVSTQVDPETP